jgi:methionyl-tRNA formyltransferase
VRISFFGSPEASVVPLRALVDAGHDVVFVVTQPDRRRGRGGALVPSPVKQAALELGLPVRTPERAREIIDEVRDAHLDLAVVVAFGQLLPSALLDTVPNGFVNVHFSLLPRWRGAAPVERAILAGDRETGVCLMRIEPSLDTGPVYACERVAIGAHETAGELKQRLVDVGTRLLVERLPEIPTSTPVPQSGETTYAEKLDVAEFALDPSRAAIELERVVRAGNPRPGAYLSVGGQRLKVWRAHALTDGGLAAGVIDADARLGTSDGVLVLDEVQPAGKRAMDAGAWRRGVHGDVRVDAGAETP